MKYEIYHNDLSGFPLPSTRSQKDAIGIGSYFFAELKSPPVKDRGGVLMSPDQISKQDFNSARLPPAFDGRVGSNA